MLLLPRLCVPVAREKGEQLASWTVAPVDTAAWLTNIDVADISQKVFADLYRLISELGKPNLDALRLLSASL